jgi:hypothetical protein
MLRTMQAIYFTPIRPDQNLDYSALMSKKERPALGQRLVDFRQAAGLTQMQLAEKLNVHHSNIAF